jgi:hypothetical protein
MRKARYPGVSALAAFLAAKACSAAAWRASDMDSLKTGSFPNIGFLLDTFNQGLTAIPLETVCGR